jgi:hypothetical protein
MYYVLRNEHANEHANNNVLLVISKFSQMLPGTVIGQIKCGSFLTS